MDRRFDIIIIGAGVGGLICGTRLAKSGFKVLIVEKHDKPGGCITSCRKKGFNFDYGAHIFGGCNKDGVLTHFLKELDVKNAGLIRLKPIERFIFPDQTIEVPQDLGHYIGSLSGIYPKEARNIEPFFKKVMMIARSFSSESLLSKYKDLTYEKLLREYFRDEKLMSVLSGQFWYLGLTPRYLAATAMCLMTASYLSGGTFYPSGGPIKFSVALAETFKKYGGTILLGKAVTGIDVKGGKVNGVMTENNVHYRSEIVVSNADVRQTFFQLIPSNQVEPSYLKRIKKKKVGASFFFGFFGVKDGLDLNKKRGWYHFSYGLDLRPEQSLYIFIPSLEESSAAPKNRHVVEMAIPFPYDFGKIKDWDGCKRMLRSRMLNIAERIMPGFEDSVEYEEMATPKTIEKYTSNSLGSMYGWEMSPKELHADRLTYETPIEGLYLAGHWTHPGCGVASAATSGWLVAKKIIASHTTKSYSLEGVCDV